MTYGEKLKDPRWQKKRLEILQRDNFTCGWCAESTKTLHVHHYNYPIGKEPWEVHSDCLISLCEDCHKTVHSGIPAILDDILTKFISTGMKSAVRIVIGTILEYQNKLNG